VDDVEAREDRFYVHTRHFQQLDASSRAQDRILLVFRNQFENVGALRKGNPIVAIGWIQDVGTSGLTLEDCELV
jgi:hypothetical protein